MKAKATHYIECFENVGSGKKRRIFDECIFLEISKNGMAKVEVTKSHKGGKGNMRYVIKDRLIDMYVKCEK